MESIITYDISDKHTEFKNEMKKLGYKDRIKGIKNCEWIYFPNTTLYHAIKSPHNANEDALEICRKLNVKLERYFSTTWNRDNWWAICGDSF
ncbi:hypothetical protein [Chryseobacterium sp. SL1]|uniref:hypothetical protein n=1 Tax=Chryseobacterium sp. SL1 TaxID=2995159 RepID=UPI002276603B|nr:hypothetical protein [Chryseobacterium sp. SL1]MCY1660106.1 hypothetical protein [Chryseobacterium sp. SL1]